KVVQADDSLFPHQLDLGEAWKTLTGMPFVFAVWMAAPAVNLGDLPERLVIARTDGLAHIDEIIAQHARPHGWPVDLAQKYLTEYLKFEIGPRQLEAIAIFLDLAARYGLINETAGKLRLEQLRPVYN